MSNPVIPDNPVTGEARHTGQRTRCCLVVLILSVLVSACSMTRIGYNMAPTLLEWRINRYVTLNEAQQAIVDKNLVALHEWHRRTQLPDYVAFLDKLTDRLSADRPRPGMQEIVAWREQLRAAWQVMPPVLAPAIAEVLSSLNGEQIDQIEAQMGREDVDAREDYQPSADSEERRNARLDRWRERAEWFLGDLTGPQRAHLASRVKAAPDTGNWWERRQRRRQQGVAMMRAIASGGQSQEQATAQVLQWLAGFGRRSANEAGRRSALSLYGDQTMVQILEMANDTQINHLVTKIGAIAEDLRSLAGLPQRQS